MAKVLIVDDQPAIRTALEMLCAVHGLATVTASSDHGVLELIASDDIGVVIQDMNFQHQETDGAAGTRLFRAIRDRDPDLPVILMTAWTALEAAVALVKEGASDYMAKPWDDDRLICTVKNLLQLRETRQDNVRLRAQASRARQQLAGRADLCGIVYASAAMHEVVQLAVSVAPSDAAVLITGPNGAGKEKLAEIIQANSRRKDRPFVKLNANDIPTDLLEAELFGAEAGAFTGAARLRIGRFEAADGGTLFLDELGNLPLAGQMKLLRVLQNREYERLGSSVTRRSDVRIVSATNVDLPRAIAEGRFREDLFFRLNVIELHLPALADRSDDIVPLAEHFLAGFAADGKAWTFGADALAALVQHDWPGNVRELQNRIQRATLVATGAVIGAADLALARGRPSTAPPLPSTPAAAPVLDDEATREKAVIEEAIVRAAGIVSNAAAALGLSRQALYRRMEKLGIVIERRPRS
jgi:DNA-binding NtrC family response regulator